MRFWVTPWLRLSLRSFLIENQIRFQPLAHQNDFAQCLYTVLLAKKLLRVPNICYVRRMRDDSLSETADNESLCHRQFEYVVRALKMFDDFVGDMDFFKKNPNMMYSLFNKQLGVNIGNFNNVSSENPPPLWYVYSLIRKYFSEYLGEHEILISALISVNLELSKTRKKLEQEFKEN